MKKNGSKEPPKWPGPYSRVGSVCFRVDFDNGIRRHNEMKSVGHVVDMMMTQCSFIL